VHRAAAAMGASGRAARGRRWSPIIGETSIRCAYPLRWTTVTRQGSARAHLAWRSASATAVADLGLAGAATFAPPQLSCQLPPALSPPAGLPGAARGPTVQQSGEATRMIRSQLGSSHTRARRPRVGFGSGSGCAQRRGGASDISHGKRP
jgi:hypothetical protein